jgi:hypothetical protein
LSVLAEEELPFFSGEMLYIDAELFRVRCEGFGDFEVDEKDAFRLKPEDVLDVVELKVDSLCVVGDPLLVLGRVLLVEVDVLLPPKMLLLPLKRPPPFEDPERCISRRPLWCLVRADRTGDQRPLFTDHADQRL